MAEQDTVPPMRKFLFDVNNFDIRTEEEPPVFSGDQVEGARRDAYEQGKQDGLAEAKGLREKHVADLLGAIKQNFTALFAAETKRAGQYEAETLFLARAVFGRLFPGLNEKHGLDEVIRAITAVLEGQRARPEIVIEVHPDFTDAIREHFGRTMKSLHEGICTVDGNADLGPGDCRLRWEDGGAARSATRLCAQIGRIFDQSLADKALLRDNSESKAGDSAPVEGDKP
jgi:flagellar assembly protein FliH